MSYFNNHSCDNPTGVRVQARHMAGMHQSYKESLLAFEISKKKWWWMQLGHMYYQSDI